MIKKVIVILFFFNNLMVSQTNENFDSFVIEVTMKDFGKANTQPDKFYEITGIPKNSIDSAFYVYEEGKSVITSIPINSDIFNYDYFREEYFPIEKLKKIKLRVKRFKIGNEVILVAYEIL